MVGTVYLIENCRLKNIVIKLVVTFSTQVDSLCSETQKLCLHAWPKMKFPATTEFAGLKKDSRHLRPDTKSAKQVNIKSYFYL